MPELPPLEAEPRLLIDGKLVEARSGDATGTKDRHAFVGRAENDIGRSVATGRRNALLFVEAREQLRRYADSLIIG